MTASKLTDTQTTEVAEPSKLAAPLTISADQLEAVAGGTLSSLTPAYGPRPVNGLVQQQM